MEVQKNKGTMFIVSGPSGVGKTVLCNAIIDKHYPQLIYSISATSREPRGGEKNGQEYFFYTRKEFEEAIDRNDFAEWAFVHGNYYGTPLKFLEDTLNSGQNIVLNIDVQGALKIKQSYPQSVMIFIAPPSFGELENRIRKRNIDTETSLMYRLENAKQEMAYKEQYEHCIVNDDLQRAIKELDKIVSEKIH